MISIEANAKINLTLDILGKRNDGYHEVSMVMQEISLHDTLKLEVAEEGICLEISDPQLPADNSNLCYKAAELIMSECGLSSGVKIKLEKRIPMAAGLAGGSADAAAVLRGMNQLFSLDLDEGELCRLGAKLGSDIPFCIMGGTMLATGRGEVLQRLPAVPELDIVLAKPKVGVSTAWAYKTYDAGYEGPHPDNKAMIQAIQSGDVLYISKLLCNVLESVTINEHAIINEYKAVMKENGALAAMMSGSGPTVFGIAPDEKAAWHIADAIRSIDGEAAVYTAKTVCRNRG
ncbi:MAG: 4-(cytidine 5'-diphospho)-2-C-methyl-D-erythritol kinase [Anaerovibrio sp.]|uniref:4-(cytidine 5'-diphospho)-2-C-methyl-D-erythritol kinase n=1 Tax=Anaerovibrio sp. TaxID=1872532 RepID=UPI0025E94BEF|nr:4-(cytidine 5'-diphospho)-2-C-methyl-D-erythritol kinase [Anaerovibrio sp.]MCR5176987.1 4-(cytidine 5'-diphospho)-2-C-methyl-D-erythritol kinase [Anaerovibrio sp.]